MRSRTVSEQWEALLPRLSRFRSWLGTGEPTHTLAPLLWPVPRLSRFRSWLGTGEPTHTLAPLLWPVVALVIAILIIRRASTAKDLADLISAIASLTWPVVVVAIVSWFRPAIRAILSRIKKGKFLGTEFELDELQAKAAVAEAKAEAASGAMIQASAGFHGAGTLAADVAQDAVEEVLREAIRSPRLGLMLLSAKIDRAARELAADTGLDVTGGPHPPLIAVVRALLQAGRLSIEDGDALILFYQVRNRILHGHDADDDEVARAIDSGNRLLRLLLSKPRPLPESERPADGG